MTKICPICGKEFDAAHRGKKYCSEECAKEAERIKSRERMRKKSLRTIENKVCPICGKEFITDNWRWKYCSEACSQKAAQECKKKYRPKAIKAVCPVCGKEFETTYATKIYCSDRCRDSMKIKARNEKGKTLHIKECEVCGKEFSAPQKEAKYCCEVCRKEAEKRRRREAYRKYRAKGISKNDKKVLNREKIDHDERKRLGAWYGKLVDKNDAAVELAGSYGKAYAPKVEVFIPDRFRSMKC